LNQNIRYRPDIDGLRAIAVLAVVFFHCDLLIAPGGYVGVDIFFVISGYVIALTLMRDLEAGQFSIRRFYEKRVRRILPALLSTLTICWIAAWILLLPNDFFDFSRSMLSSALSVSNFYFWRTSGYFETSALLRPLLHTWSLSVEEQFYLIVPASLWICYRYFNARFVLLFGSAALLSLGLSIYATDTAPTANFFLLPTRAWELLTGVILAVCQFPTARPAIRQVLALVGAVLITGSIIGYTKYTPFPGLSALAPCLGTAFIIFAGTRGTSIVNRALSWSPLVFIGLVSYSFYLIHWPLLVFLRYTTLRAITTPEAILVVASSFVLATLSWKFIEQPFRRPQGYIRRHALGTWAATTTLMMSIAAAGIVTHGAPQRFPDIVHKAAANDENLWKNGTCFLIDNLDPHQWDQKNCVRTSGGPEKILLWGDSFAAHYTPGLMALSATIPASIIQYTAAGCPPVLSYYSYARPKCTKFNENALSIIRKNGIKKVILASRWSDLQSRGLDSIQSTIEALRSMGVEVWVIGQSPEFAANVQIIDYKNRHSNAPRESWPLAFDPEINSRLRQAAHGSHFIDPLAYLCDGLQCPYRNGDTLYYADYGHFSKEGSIRAVKAYFPVAAAQLSASNEDRKNGSKSAGALSKY
jgi:peptidoglycan/LPS O-acetylase OafA/YrhL